jgi:hypothetical protein
VDRSELESDSGLLAMSERNTTGHIFKTISVAEWELFERIKTDALPGRLDYFKVIEDV